MIEIRELYKYYGARRALGPITATIQQGEIVGLLGLNGAGKTTTLRILACDLLPSSGTVLVDGVDVVEHPEQVRAHIGYLPDRPPLYDEMTVDEFLRFVARLRGLAKGSLNQRVETVLESTGLGEQRHDPIASLSHGYRQRVGIAQAIVHQPKLVVLDEPIAGLDPVQIVEMRSLVRNLRGDHTVLVSSHILGEISETCDRIFVVGNGQIIASGTEKELGAQFAGGTSVLLTVRCTAEKKARLDQALATQAGVTQVTSVAPTEMGADVLSYQVQCQDDIREHLAAAAMSVGAGVLQITRGERELENVFLRLAGESARQKDRMAAGAVSQSAAL
ncbi:MAG TPA: ABC transporter ATP-binding protein [Polyangiaceae bacterium]|nr:ABC transporter ATP-binding protein [Polyangiaceae bacterium]